LASAAAAQRLGLDLDTYRVGDGGDLADPQARFLACYGLAPDGAALLRPDRLTEAVHDRCHSQVVNMMVA